MMNSRIKSVIPLILLALILFSACNKKDDKTKFPEVKAPAYDNTLPGKEGMKNTVLGYSQAIIDAHLSDLHVKFIRKYASEKETKRVSAYIHTDREKDQAMAMRLNKITFDNISTSAAANFADTTEHWDFHYLDIKTSKPLNPVKEMRYKLRYLMERDGDKWVVGKIRERETTVMGDYNPPRWSVTGE